MASLKKISTVRQFSLTIITPVRGGGNLCQGETGGPGLLEMVATYDRMRATVFFLPHSKVRVKLDTASW